MISVLVVDDEPDILDVFEQNLSMLGYETTVTRSGKEGLELFFEKEFDVVITDIKLTDISGIDVVREIMDHRKDTIVLVITGYASVKSSMEALRLGAVDYFPKPVNIKHLNIVIKRTLENLELSKSIPAHPNSKKKRNAYHTQTANIRCCLYIGVCERKL